MPASIRIIKIMKDKNPVDGSEVDDYTVEFECIVDDSSKLAQELAKCPLGERAMSLIERAQFIPEGTRESVEVIKKEAEEEEKARLKREEELREEGRQETREKYVRFLKEKRISKRATEAIEDLAIKENKETRKRKKEEEEKLAENANQDNSADFERDNGFHSIMPT